MVAWVTLAALLALVAWEASGLDLALTRWIATPTGFPWRDSFIASRVLHDGGRAFAWLLMSLLVLDAFRPLLAGPTRGERLYAIGVVLAAAVLVPMLRRFSSTSCPWELAEFGGAARHLSHWRWGVTDGGPGHCFPSGHASAAFSFLGGYFALRPHHPLAARRWLGAVLGLGLLFGLGQTLRGAHYPSHTLWTAWICLALTLASYHGWHAWRRG